MRKLRLFNIGTHLPGINVVSVEAWTAFDGWGCLFTFRPPFLVRVTVGRGRPRLPSFVVVHFWRWWAYVQLRGGGQ